MDPHEKTARRAGYGFLLVFILLAAGIVASGFFSYRNYKRNFRVGIERQLLGVAELKVNELVAWRAERLADASIFFRNASFSGLVRQFLEKPKDSAAQDGLRIWLSHFQAAYEYDRLFFLDDQGVERISVPAESGPAAVHLMERTPEFLRSDKVTFVDFHRDAPDGPVHLSILVPIVDDRADVRALGILVLRIDPKKYLFPFIRRWPMASQTAEALIVRRDENDVLFLNELKFQKDSALNLRIPLGSQNVLAVKAVLGQEGLVEGVDYRGVPVLGALRAVPDSPWFLVAHMDIAEAFAPLRERAWVTILLIGSLLLGAGGGIGFVWRHQRAHFYRERYRAAEALREVSLRQAALLAAVPDIIMEVDDNKVYTWANRAGLQFFGEDVIGKEAAFYFEGEQDTYQTVKPLFDGYEGVIYVESWQRRRDGEKRLLAWSCRVLKDDNGRVTGALSSAHDITERKQAEAALRESEERFRTLYENSTLGLYRTTPDGRIVLANPALVTMLGYSSFDDLSGRDLKTDGFEPSYPRTQFVEMVANEGAVRGLESAWKRRDGTTVFVRESARAICDPEGRTVYFDGTVEDITGRKEAEEEIRRKNASLEAISDIFKGALACETSEEVGRLCLHLAQKLTGSKMGFIGEVNAAGGFDTIALSDPGWENCKMPNSDAVVMIKNMKIRGIWGRVITARKSLVVNQPSSHPDRVGLPEGHPPITAFLGVPLEHAGGTIGMISLANKESGYSSIDREMVESLSGAFVEALMLKRAEEAQRRAEENYHRSLDDSPLGVRIVTAEGDTLYANKAILDLYGFDSLEELNKTPLKNRYTPQSYTEHKNRLIQRQKVDFPSEYEISIVRKNGEVRVLQVFRKEVRWNGGKQFQALYRDITERKKAEEALAHEQSLLSALMDNATDQVYFKDAHSRFIRISKAQAERFGLRDPAQAVSKTDFDFFAEDHARPAFEDEQKIMKTGRPLVDLEEKETWPNGRVAWVSTTKVPLRDKQGQIIGTFGISRDITAHKMAEERLNETLQRLRLAITSTIQVLGLTVEARDPYTAGHQQRTTILAEAIAREMGLPPEKIEGLHMAGLVHDVGKISIPAEILSKPTKLTPGEYALVRTHAQRGYEILKDVEFPWPLAEIVYEHHERMDGSGYPRGLKGDEILMEARILSVSDTVEAIVSDRPYRPAQGVDTALAEVEKNKGILYDADVAETCLKLFRKKRFSFPA